MLRAAAEGYKLDSSLWHKSEAFRRHKRHGLWPALASLFSSAHFLAQH